MKIILKTKVICLLLLLVFVLTFAQQASAEAYKSLEGVKSIKTIFDFRDGLPGSVLVHIKLIHDTYKDKNILVRNPEFAVVFMGSSVKLLSKNRDGFSSEDKKTLEKIDKVISAMSKDGIRLEICMFAVNFFGLAPDSILPEINQVENGWISSIGYQEKGYALIPVF